MSLDWTVTPSNPSVGSVRFTLTPADSTGNPIERAYIRLEGDMKHPGMQPVVAEATESDPGTYTGTLNLTMAGDWVIEVDATLPGGGSFRRTIDLTVSPAR